MMNYEWTLKEVIQSAVLILTLIMTIIGLLKIVKAKAKVEAITGNELKHIKEDMDKGFDEAKIDRRDLWTKVNDNQKYITELFGDIKYLRGKQNGRSPQ